MKKINQIALFIFMLLFSAASFAQEKTTGTQEKKIRETPKQQKAREKVMKEGMAKMDKAELLTEKYNYDEAIKTYLKIEEKGFRTASLYKKLGDAYYANNDAGQAIRWYRELFKLKKEVIEPEYYYRLAQSLKTVGKYDDANKLLDELHTIKSDDQRGDLFDKNRNYINSIESNSGRYKVKITTASSTVSDYGAAFYGTDKIVFTSNRDSLGVTARKDRWTNKAFTALYIAEIGPKGDLVRPQKFSSRVQTKLHESTPVFTKDKQVMYFTKNNLNDGKLQKDDKDRILLKIYRAEADGDKWKNIKELPFTSNSYNTAHPCLSPDEKTLFFASDMPGGYGMSDIYSVSINEDGTFGNPENLGPGINTEARETFPFVTETKIYFASDGHPGLGGLDVFVAELQANGTYVKALNVGEPINTHFDDFGFIINEESRMGYFTSNRTSGIGYDDVYSLTEYIALDFTCRQFISGIVSDKETKKAIAGAKVTLYDADENLMEEMVTAEDGVYYFGVDCERAYTVKIQALDYLPKEMPTEVTEKEGDVVLPAVMEKPEKIVEPEAPNMYENAAPVVGLDLAKKFRIEQIYFNTGRYNIRPDAAKQLDKIVAFMKEYPSIRIDIRSHTDSRGPEKQNQLLSENRAREIMAYIIRKGIDSKRLTAKGYGESQLVNKCSDWVKCSEKEHQANRRSEFIITEM
ncbi:OmpA family protein [Flavobacterium sp. AG291]|uniref:OmpA family protein n=1 Tax=Flavobacterium sp. AG291 TaxID=2184000 RepID=UPI000E0B2395|nr:OmpA family protein [Flavobacterium sp. AG291]RDI09709.1 carboxypeptidase family protein [Flavobacterium sp. AG291]